MILLYILIAMQVVDGWTTWQCFRNGAIEANAAVAWLIGLVGPFLGLVIAKSFVVAIVVVAGRYGAWTGDLGQVLLLALAGFYAWVCWNNLRILYGNGKA
jgi:hypothetical protein